MHESANHESSTRNSKCSRDAADVAMAAGPWLDCRAPACWLAPRAASYGFASSHYFFGAWTRTRRPAQGWPRADRACRRIMTYTLRWPFETGALWIVHTSERGG